MPLVQTAGLVAAGLLTTGSLFAGAAPSSDQAGDSVDDGPRVPCGAVWSRLPDDLRDDLTAVRDFPQGERRDALREIRRDALDGDYGAKVQRFAERRHQRVRAVRRALPADLRADLRAAAKLSGDARVEAFEEIRDDALAGDYGDRVQDVAERVQHRREACRGS